MLVMAYGEIFWMGDCSHGGEERTRICQGHVTKQYDRSKRVIDTVDLDKAGHLPAAFSCPLFRVVVVSLTLELFSFCS